MGPKKQKTKENAEANVPDFQWTDDELELLINAALVFKEEELFKGNDWEGIRKKYESIRDIFIERYPKTNNDEEDVDVAKFPNWEKCEEVVTRERVGAKIKKIRKDFRKAVDVGKRSGGGRVVFMLYDKCEELWGGCPSVTSINGGIDSSEDPNVNRDDTMVDVDADIAVESTEVSDDENNQTDDISNENNDENSNPTDENSSNTKEAGNDDNSYRKNVTKYLKDRKDKKLTPKISHENQMLNLAKEDMKLKKQLIQKFTKDDDELKQSLTAVNSTMASTGSSIQDSVKLLGEIVKNQSSPSVENREYHQYPMQSTPVRYEPYPHGVPNLRYQYLHDDTSSSDSQLLNTTTEMNVKKYHQL